MRPLWRSLLWLGLAAASGAAGVWLGLGWGARTAWNLSFQSRVSEDFGRASRVLEALAASSPSNRAYVESNLRFALADIGVFHEPWMECYPRDRQTLAAARLYLRGHPGLAFGRDANKALAVCSEGDAVPVPPIADGSYRFELRDPEFPQLAPVPLRARVDATHIVFETDEASSRFPKGTRLEGELAWHGAEGKWVLATNPADASAKEAGGCADGPDVVDLERLVLWVC